MGKILVELGERKKLMKIFGKSHVTVRRALNGQTNTLLAQKIRKAAIERGGMEQTKTENQ
jgi:hypothetical protein